MPTILRVHTDTGRDDDFRNHHAWWSMEKDGVARHFGFHKDNSQNLDGHEEQRLKGWNGSGDTHIREGVDASRTPTATYEFPPLSAEQEGRFWRFMDDHSVSNGHQFDLRENNCTHCARDVVEATTGQRLDIEAEIHGRQYPCPIGMERSIHELNRGHSFEASDRTMDDDVFARAKAEAKEWESKHGPAPSQNPEDIFVWAKAEAARPPQDQEHGPTPEFNRQAGLER